MAAGARAAALVIAISGGVSGCGPGLESGFDSAEPGARLFAIEEAGRTNDRGAVKELIGLLDSDDPAVRIMAIRTLERMEGTTRGYEHAGAEVERRAAVERWVEWYEEEHGARGAAKAEKDVGTYTSGSGEPSPSGR